MRTNAPPFSPQRCRRAVLSPSPCPAAWPGRKLFLIQTKAAEQYLEMAKELRTKALGAVVPWVGGMTVNDKETYAEDDSLVQPSFARRMMVDPWVGSLGADADDDDLPL